MNGVQPCLSVLSSWPILVLNCHSLAIEASHVMDDKWAHGVSVQPGELPLMPDNQLAQLKVEQGPGIHLDALNMLVELQYSTLSLPNAVARQPLELPDYVASVR